MKAAIFCFTDSGAQLALRLCDALKLTKSAVHSTTKLAKAYSLTPHESVFADMDALFHTNEALIFVSACGIAVRAIAPHLRDKTTDPAVLAIDDGGRFVIPLLSGHIGGANRLARLIAGHIGAAAVITTATDGMGRFSCDAWAAENDCAIASMESAKAVSAAILTRDIPISSKYPLPETLPDGLIKSGSGELGIYIGVRIETPYTQTLRLIPRVLNVGVGCRRDTPEERILSAVRAVFENNAIDLKSIKRIASVDIKKDEAGLLKAAEALGAKTVFFSAEELDRAPGVFSESDFVRDTVGTGCVCERAAVLAGGELIIKKTVLDGVTVAVSQEQRRIAF